jgi:hypothetical protein
MQLAHRFALVLSTVSCVALMADVAGARGPQGGGTRSGSAHREATRTGPNGSSQTWKRDTTWQRGGGSYDRHTTQTGPKGGTRSRDVHAERTEMGHTRSTTFSDAQGRTATREAEVVKDREAGTRMHSVEWTGRGGQIASRVTETQKTETGRESTTTLTRPDGSSVRGAKSITHPAGGSSPQASD